MTTKILIILITSLMISSCESQRDKDAKYRKTPIGRLFHAEAVISVAKDVNDKKNVLSGLKELESIVLLFPNTKEARIADSIIKNQNVIYTEIENNIQKEISLIEDNLFKTRQEYETFLRNFFLDNELDIKVKISGEKYTNIVLTYILFNDVWRRKFETQGLFDNWAKLGFKQITLTDDYDYTKSISYE